MVAQKAKKRAPDAFLAKARKNQKKARKATAAKAMTVEAHARKTGGYGQKTVSVWAIPKGGIEKSPAYIKVVSRCGLGGRLPPAADRAGAPVDMKAAFPLSKYPPNVIVDGLRFPWLPDDWAQVVKNTGPGGSYIGWFSPEGKFFYHRNGYPTAIEEYLGRPLTVMDGINGIKRTVEKQVSVKNDTAFLNTCLTGAEKKNVLPANKFHFAVVSARRADNETGMHSIMVIETCFKLVGVKATWYVDAPSLDAYKALGLKAVVGGKLCPARNMALNDAAKKNLICVQVSDDISKWSYYDVEKQNMKGQKTFEVHNKALEGAPVHTVSPLAAAQWMLAKMRSSPLQPKLAGVLPTGNAAMAMGLAEYNTQHFILGDFFVADHSPVRFDEEMTLKEDYDYACQHIAKHGSVLRCNRMVISARHATNSGGAVAYRNGQKERANIAILQRKWPGVFKSNVKRPNEVLMNWNNHGKSKNTMSVVKTVVKGGEKRSVRTKVMPVGKISAKTKLKYTGKDAPAYIKERLKKCHGKTMQQCLLEVRCKDSNGNLKSYGMADLRYDLKTGRLQAA